ncbi:MAG TPA: DUF2891 domain-containing protein [Rhizomicrobium sp.]|nr:DUF2891 domain-containing protein [Rhizomicrobium sp.]
MMDPRLTQELAERYIGIALGHVTKEYPNKLDHVMTQDADARAPRDLHPIFYGSFDWHSCVHSYWLLARLLRLFPDNARASDVFYLFESAFTEANVADEAAYLARPSSGGFERPYGWAWALMLAAELRRSRDQRWTKQFAPLERAFAARFMQFLPKLTYPIRGGTHGNTAFALILTEEYARAVGDTALKDLMASRARYWFSADSNAPAWEPSGDDFLSGTLVEAECMRALLPPDEFARWFSAFLPTLDKQEPKTLFTPATVSDRSDGKIAHLDGLNLSRAWCMKRMANSLGQSPLAAILRETAEHHIVTALPHVAGDYMGEHWLATYALMALGPVD